MNVYSLLDPGAISRPDKVAIVCNGHELTYRDLSDTTSSLASRLQENFNPGEILPLWLHNSPELICLILACFKAGVIPMPMHREMTLPEVDTILKLTGTRYLVSSSSLLEQGLHNQTIASLDKIYVVDPKPMPSPFIPYSALMGKRDDCMYEPSRPIDTALILLTSGTTGQPKAVLLSHASLVHILEYRLNHTNLDSNSYSIVGSCLTQSMGLYQTLALLAAGATLALLESYDTEQMVPLINASSTTHLIMSIDAFNRLLQHPELTPESLRDIKFAAAGADRVTPNIQKRFIELAGRPLSVTYGLTESSWALVNPGELQEKSISIGKPCPGIRIKLLDPDGNEIQGTETGQIYINSPRTMLGYLNDESGTSDVLDNGWLATGDLACRDSDGYYWFAGRCKNIIVLSTGDNVSPLEIETAILSHPSVENCIVTSIDNGDGTEIPWAFVTCKDNDLTRDTLYQYLGTRLSRHKLPQELIFLPGFPTGLTGKVNIGELKRMAMSMD